MNATMAMEEEVGDGGGGQYQIPCQAEAEIVYQSLHTRVLRVSDANKSLGGRTGHVAIKILLAAGGGGGGGDDDCEARRLDDSGEADGVTSLYDEYMLSRRPLFSRCESVRAALRRTRTREGLHAIYLEWAPGVTLREWIRVNVVNNATPSNQKLLLSAVRLAWRIVRGIREIHEAGVVHNNMTADNIIVDTRRVGKFVAGSGDEFDNEEGVGGGGDLDFSVKIIDLGSAALLKMNDDEFSASAGARGLDLFSLGVLLYELFSGGRRPLRNVDLYEKNDTIPELHELGEDHQCPFRVPRSLSTIVSNLIGGRSGHFGNEHRYQCASEVEEDLFQILDYPERFMFDGDGARMGDGGGGIMMGEDDPLDFPIDKLYGRHSELSMLLNSYSRVTAPGGVGRSEMVMVSGISGSGKSCLVRRARKHFVERGGYFLSGKYDSLRQVEPLSALIAAFAEYFEGLVESGEAGALDEMRRTIVDRIGPDGISVLVGLFPGLRRVVGTGSVVSPAAEVGGMEGQNRFKHLFSLFVRAISSPFHPLVLFLDDLQWADVASLDLLRTLLAADDGGGGTGGGGGGSFLFIGCYRDCDVGPTHRLSVQLAEIERQDVPVTRIKLEPIGLDDMNHLIADALRVPMSIAGPLTDLVYDKTNGNVFFAIQFLKYLFDDGLVRFCPSSGSWRWDLERIRSENMADGAVTLLAARILRLPAGVRGALEVAACLGRRCDSGTLSLLIEDEMKGADGISNHGPSCESNHYLGGMLDLAVGHGLMNKVGSRYEFIHDQIQRAVYTLLSESERGALHLQIGKRIWKKSSPTKLEEVLFVAVDQLNLASIYVDPDERTDLVGLNLRAGRRAMSLSLFLPAATYLKAGIDLLRPGHWDDQYDLSLQLYESYAETEYCNGNFDGMGDMLSEIFARARCFEEKLGAYYTLVNAFGARDRLQEGIQTGLLVLEQLGEPFPDSGVIAESTCVATDFHVPEWTKTKVMLEEFTDDALMAMNVMVDESKITVMRFLKPLGFYTYMLKGDYLPLITFRMMQLSLRYGVCKESAFAFVMYGIISCKFGDPKRGYQFGQLAIQLLERFDANDCVAQIYGPFYGCISPLCEHLKVGLEPLLSGYQFGMMFGDTQFAAGNARILCLSSFQCGRQLALLEKEMAVFCEKLAKCNQDNFLSLILITRQTAQNLMGRSNDPLQLTGDAMDQEQMLTNALEKKNLAMVCDIHIHRLWLAYYFGDYALAADSAERSRENLRPLAVLMINHAFYDGLTSLALARETKLTKWRTLALRALEKMKNWAELAPCNFQNKVALMEAELAFLEEYSNAGNLYESAIALAGEHGFLHEQALACERAAMFHFDRGDRSKASHYYDQAHDLYLEWGARGKADQLRAHSLSFLTANTS